MPPYLFVLVKKRYFQSYFLHDSRVQIFGKIIKETVFPVIFQSTISTYVCVFIVYLKSLSVYIHGVAKSLHPPLVSTSTPLFRKQTWMTEQPASAFPVWRRQSEQCFLTGELQALHTLSQTQLFLPQQV